jgi:GTPase
MVTDAVEWLVLGGDVDIKLLQLDCFEAKSGALRQVSWTVYGVLDGRVLLLGVDDAQKEDAAAVMFISSRTVRLVAESVGARHSLKARY